jgi:hypothetical protein
MTKHSEKLDSRQVVMVLSLRLDISSVGKAQISVLQLFYVKCGSQKERFCVTL